MKTLPISFPEQNRSYTIFVGKNILENLDKLIAVKKYSKLFVITDTNLKKQLQIIENNLENEIVTYKINPGEKEKNIETVQKIWKAMLNSGLDRHSLVINLGGGVICDMGGFAASTYMRGVDFINIPTTLLSEVDASVGGKTGFDFGEIKNLIGNFTQPQAVIIDVTTLQTLPKREFLSGFAEIIKHGLILDKDYFEKVTSKNPLAFSKEELVEIIARSCEIKAAVVQNDEKESGNRKLLNFGHTIGHAVEALSLETDKPLLHGEAVSIGMVAEAMLAQELGLISASEVTVIQNVLKNAGLPITLPDFPIKTLITKMQSDKKNTGGKINFTLLKELGIGIINQTVLEKTINKVLTQLHTPGV